MLVDIDFAEDENFQPNVLGHRGFLERQSLDSLITKENSTWIVTVKNIVSRHDKKAYPQNVLFIFAILKSKKTKDVSNAVALFAT
jgi:hypothetical protein